MEVPARKFGPELFFICTPLAHGTFSACGYRAWGRPTDRGGVIQRGAAFGLMAHMFVLKGGEGREEQIMGQDRRTAQCCAVCGMRTECPSGHGTERLGRERELNKEAWYRGKGTG